jgi:hypothetical protein
LYISLNKYLKIDWLCLGGTLSQGNKERRWRLRMCDTEVSVMFIGWSDERIRTRSCVTPLRRSNEDVVTLRGETELSTSRSTVLKSKSSVSETFATTWYPFLTRSTAIVWNSFCWRSVHRHAITFRTNVRSSGCTHASMFKGISFTRSDSGTSRCVAMSVYVLGEYVFYLNKEFGRCVYCT